jgi:hypothetical protein
MYGLSKDAESYLSFLIGKEICQVAIGSYDVQFHVNCSAPGTLQLGFSNGDRMEIFEDERYESFSIHDGENHEILV